MKKNELILRCNPISTKYNDIEIRNVSNDITEVKRSNILQSIIQTGNAISKSALRNNEIYKIAFDAQTLQKGKDGFYRGVIYNKSGKIVEHAKLEKVNSTLVNSIRTAGTQALLLNICIQLSDIQKSIHEIFAEFHNDRISQLQSKIELFELSQTFTREQRLFQVSNIYHFILEGVLKLIAEIKAKTNGLEKINNGFFRNWGKSSTQQADEIIPQIEEATIFVYRGIDIGIKALITLEQPQEAITQFLEGSISKLKQLDFNLIHEKSRFCSPKVTHLPENFFSDAKTLNKNILAKYKNTIKLSSDQKTKLSIEFNSDHTFPTLFSIINIIFRIHLRDT